MAEETETTQQIPDAPEVKSTPTLDKRRIESARDKTRNAIENLYNGFTNGVSKAKDALHAINRYDDPGDAPTSKWYNKPFEMAGNLADGVLLTPLRGLERVATPALQTLDKITRATGNLIEGLFYPVTHPINTIKALTIIGAKDALKDEWGNLKSFAGNITSAAGKSIKTAATVASEPIEAVNDAVSRGFTRTLQVVSPEPLSKVWAVPRWLTRKAKGAADWVKSRPAWLLGKMKP